MITLSPAPSKELKSYAGPLALFAFEDGSPVGAGFLPPKVRKELAARAEDEDFRGRRAQVSSFRASDGLRDRRFVFVGLGKKKEFGGEVLRKCAGALYHAAKTRFDELWVSPPESASTTTMAEGLLLAAHLFGKYRKAPDDLKLTKVRLVTAKPSDRGRFQSAIERAALNAEAVGYARDLVNEGPSDKSPEPIAAAARSFAGTGVTVKVIDRKQAEKLGMGSYLGVARGSTKPPYFLHLIYKPKGKIKKRIGLIGKGVTFDSGGLSLKPPMHMETMKSDMAGAATVLGVFKVLSRMKIQAEVHGITPLTYNMPGPDAIKPGDVVRAMNGKTIEILNTDAEGRLILADALVYATKLKLDVMIDLATLTGAAVVALGSKVTAAMTNDRPALKKLLAASKKTDEAIWELPLVEDYKGNIKSKIADLQNIGKAKGEAGTIIGGIFLQEFVDNKPWIHLDIAGPAWSDSGNGYCGPGGTGAMTRTLLEYLKSI